MASCSQSQPSYQHPSAVSNVAFRKKRGLSNINIYHQQANIHSAASSLQLIKQWRINIVKMWLCGQHQLQRKYQPAGSDIIVMAYHQKTSAYHVAIVISKLIIVSNGIMAYHQK